MADSSLPSTERLKPAALSLADAAKLLAAAGGLSLWTCSRPLFGAAPLRHRTVA
jgi:hypothetical protein